MYEYDLGIVIVNYNVRHFLAQCLLSIKNSQIQGLKTEIWVVDNASVDGSVTLLESEYPGIQLIANKENKGFSAANNQAIRLMHSQYVLLLNPDTLLEEDTLYKCYKFMEENEKAGAVGVRMIDGAGKFLPESKRKIPDLWNSFCKLSYLSDLLPRSEWFSGYNLGYLPEKETNEVDVLCGAFMFIRSSVLDKAGLLDESFFMYGEDIDLSHRILKAGFKIYYFPDTSIVHYKGESTKKESINYIRTFYGAMIIYVNKHYTKGSATVFSRILRIAITIRAIISAMFKVFISYGCQFIDAIIIYYTLLFIKTEWAILYFNNIDYYAQTHIHLVLFLCSLMWVFFLWLAGHYDKKSTFGNTMTGVFIGTAVLLMAYALLPENLRTSRAIILMGVVVTFIVSTLSRLIVNKLKYSKNRFNSLKNVAIVATKNNALRLGSLVKKINPAVSSIHYISPEKLPNDAFYSNDLKNLESILRTLNIDEIIYSSEDMTFKQIIRSMSNIGSQASFKIGGDDSLSLIGSTNRDKQGELYSFDLHYRLAKEHIVRLKRLFDIIVALFFIPLSPVLYIVSGFKLRIFSNIIEVIYGAKTWVGYGGNSKDFSFLPEIRKGVLKYPQISKILNYLPNYFKSHNTEYAKNYSLWIDLKTIYLNIHKLGNAE